MIVLNHLAKQIAIAEQDVFHAIDENGNADVLQKHYLVPNFRVNGEDLPTLAVKSRADGNHLQVHVQRYSETTGLTSYLPNIRVAALRSRQ